MATDSEIWVMWLRSPFGWVLAGLWGAIWGSFANVCVHRIPRGESVVLPGSHCPACQQPIAWHDNIPILGWLLLRGHCRRCQAAISPRYLLIELVAIVLTLLLYSRFVAHVVGAAGDANSLLIGVVLSRFVVYFFFVLTLLVLSVIDIEHQILPDRITYPAIPLFFLLGRLLAWQSSGVSLAQAAVGMVGGYLVVRLLADGYYYLTGREGLGYGDGKLLSLAGALLGWRALPFTMLFGSLAGLLIAVPLLLWRRRGQTGATPLRHTPVVFGPFLAVGAVVFLLLFHERDIETLILRLLAPLLGEAV